MKPTASWSRSVEIYLVSFQSLFSLFQQASFCHARAKAVFFERRSQRGRLASVGRSGHVFRGAHGAARGESAADHGGISARAAEPTGHRVQALAGPVRGGRRKNGEVDRPQAGELQGREEEGGNQGSLHVPATLGERAAESSAGPAGRGKPSVETASADRDRSVGLGSTVFGGPRMAAPPALRDPRRSR